MKEMNNYFDFGINKTYIDPLYPKRNESVKFSILGLSDNTIITLHYKKQGTWRLLTLDGKKIINESFAYYFANIVLNEDTLFYFGIQRDLSFYYYSELYFSVAHPSDCDCFELKIDIEPPSWASNSTCYQIYPDRFKNGNPNLGVRDNEYKFDGATSTQMSFDEKPLTFEEGKCLDFFNGDLKGIEDSLSYLKELGINCIYLNPIGVAKTTHRYDCCDFFHVDPKLGGDEALISLIHKAHELSIKIIVDISINHTGIDHPWFKKALMDKSSKEAGYYYIDDSGEIAFWQNVKTLPQLNYNNQELRDIIYRDKDSVIKKFLKPPFNQDGWRFDVADEVGRKDSDQFNDEIWKQVRKSIKEENKEAYILAESWIDSSSHLQGDQWDATMNYFGCSRPCRRWMGEEDRYTCENWGHSPRKVNEYSAKDLSLALSSQLKSIPDQIAQFQFNLIDSHDTPRLHNNKEVFELHKYMGVIMLMYSLPGMPNVFYGDEIGIDGQMGSMEMGRYPMPWDRKKWDKSFLNLYKSLGELRETYKEVFYLGAYKIIDLDENLFSLIRYNEDKVIFTILNKCDTKQKIDLDIPYLLLDNLDKAYFDVEVKEKCVYLKSKENAVIVFNRKNSK